MLRRSGWSITAHRDVTVAYAQAIGRLLAEEQAYGEELGRLYGLAEFAETQERRRMTAKIAGRGLLRRQLFAAAPAPPSTAGE